LATEGLDEYFFLHGMLLSAVGGSRKTVTSGRAGAGEAQLYESTASIAVRQRNAQQVFRRFLML
jgi:hypothetical protein